MAQTYRTSCRVEWHDTDAAGIAHFTAFFRWMEEAEHEFLRHVGLSVLMHDAQGPITWPRVAVGADFRSVVRFEDVLAIELEIDRLGQRSVSYRFHLTHAGRDVAELRLTAACCRIDADGHPRAVHIPESIAAKLLPFCEPRHREEDPPFASQ